MATNLPTNFAFVWIRASLMCIGAACNDSIFISLQDPSDVSASGGFRRYFFALSRELLWSVVSGLLIIISRRTPPRNYTANTGRSGFKLTQGTEETTTNTNSKFIFNSIKIILIYRHYYGFPYISLLRLQPSLCDVTQWLGLPVIKFLLDRSLLCCVQVVFEFIPCFVRIKILLLLSEYYENDVLRSLYYCFVSHTFSKIAGCFFHRALFSVIGPWALWENNARQWRRMN